MSVITDWQDDYTGADTNTPTSATSVPDPVDGTNDLGAVLRDLKKVIRGESLNKAWSSDPVTATYVGATSFNTAGNLTATYTTGQALNINLNGTYVYAYVTGLSYSAPNTLVTIGSSVLNSNLTTVAFSSVYPHWTPARGVVYTVNTGSSLPWRVTQIGQFELADTQRNPSIRFPQAEYDTLYQAFFQPLSSRGVTPATDHFSIVDVSKSATVLSPTMNTGPGVGSTVRWEYCIVRIT